MWQLTKIEKHVSELLSKEMVKGTELFTIYEHTRNKLINDIYEEIRGVDPDLSDHGEPHIRAVLENVRYLLSTKKNFHGFSGVELYCLLMMVLFHDVGNLFGRENHEQKVSEIFTWARGTDASLRRERTLVLRGIRAHTGKASDGSFDTLKELGVEDHVYGERVQFRSIAAVLRLADELAEGPRRTSEFLRLQGGYTPESQIYHDYASITNIRADRGTERISLTYEIEIMESFQEGRVPEEDLTKLLEFVYKRVTKLDQERKYTKFYSSALSPFKATNVTMNFHVNGQLVDLDLANLTLDDKVVPGSLTLELQSIDPKYELGELVRQLIAFAREG